MKRIRKVNGGGERTRKRKDFKEHKSIFLVSQYNCKFQFCRIVIINECIALCTST